MSIVPNRCAVGQQYYPFRVLTLASVIFMPNVRYDSKNYNEILYAIEKNHVEIVYPNIMDTFSLDGILFTVLSPASDYYDNLNDYSIELRMDYNNISFLFTGDAETKAETEMRTNDNLNLDVDVLKASHHGSGTSNTAQFVYKADPRYVVISVGAINSYGHPDNIVLNRFITYGVEEIYRSDKDGTITTVTNGSSITFSTIDTNIDGKGSTSTPVVTTPAVTTPAVTTSATTTAPVTSTKIVEIVKVDKKAEIVTIRNNTSNDINMTGWRLVSVKGNQVFNFPTNYILKANSTITISSGDSAGDLQWTKANVWNNSESDPAELYNGTTLIDRWDD
jgi:competence protein ComEC